MKHFLIFVLNLFLCLALHAQNSIYLQNPSFEDLPKSGQAPNGWLNCGFAKESPPDVQPGSFEVIKRAGHGNTYLGMTVRDNESWESVGQRLSAPLLKDSSYAFSIWLARSEMYLSQSQTTKEPANYTTPAKLVIWGGNKDCERAEVLGESAIVTHTNWMQYDFVFQPQDQAVTYFTLEAYYKEPVKFPYNGNLLLDNCSAIEKMTVK